MDQQELEFGSSHRPLTLPGNQWDCTVGRWGAQKFQDTGVLQWRSEVAAFNGIIRSVPAGRWQVELMLYVTENGDANVEEAESPVLHFQTGRTANAAIDSGHWFRFFMGTITTPSSGGSVQLRIRNNNLPDGHLIDISIGGFVLRPRNVAWKREAILLRILLPSTDDTNEEKFDASPLYQLPRDVVIHIAQYLITPMPNETLLVGNK